MIGAMFLAYAGCTGVRVGVHGTSLRVGGSQTASRVFYELLFFAWFWRGCRESVRRMIGARPPDFSFLFAYSRLCCRGQVGEAMRENNSII